MVTRKFPVGYEATASVLRYAAKHKVGIMAACAALKVEALTVTQTVRTMREYYLQGSLDKIDFDAFLVLRDQAEGGQPFSTRTAKGRSVVATESAAAEAAVDFEEARVHTEQNRDENNLITGYYFAINQRDKAPLTGLFSRSEMEQIYTGYPYMTVNQLTESFPSYNSAEMRRILRAFGITKDRRFPPHILEERDPEEVSEFALNARERVAYKKLDLNRAGFVEKKLRQTQEQLWDLREEQDVVNRLTSVILDRYIEEGRLAPAPPVAAYRPRYGEHRPVGEPSLVFYGDCHFGKLFETDQLMGRGRGTTRAILTERLLSLAQETVSRMQASKTNEVHLFNLGDVFESLLPDGMHPQHAHEMELKAEEQLLAALEAHELMLAYIIEHAGVPKEQLRIVMHGLGGNHDRLGKSRDEDKRRTGALIFYAMLQKVLNYQHPGLVDVRTYPEGVFSVVVGSINVIGFHGDSLLGKAKATDILNRFRSGDSSLYTIIANGHYHATVTEEGHNFLRMTVGPVCSADDYVQNNLGKGSQPSAMFVETSPGYGVDLHKKTLY